MIAPTLNCGGGGDCAPGEECLPDNYIDPADCPTVAPCFALLAHTFENDNDVATTPPIDTTGATLLVACISTPQQTIDSFTDSEGNIWEHVDEDTGGAQWAFVYYCDGPTTSAAHTITVESGSVAVTFAAFSGPPIVGAFDTFTSVNGTAFQVGSGSPPSPGSITPSADNALIVTMAGGDDLTDPYVAGYQVYESHPGEVFVSGAIYSAFAVQGAATATNPEWVAPEVTDPEVWGGAIMGVAFLTDIECSPSAACPDCEPCTEAACDADAYQPFCIGPENATDLDTAILALSPHAYLKLDDASGNPVDSSGNGNNATAISGASYSQSALTTKANAGIRLTGAITLPPPVSDPSNPGQAWTAIWLAQWHTFNTNATANGFPGILNWCGGSPPKFMLSTCFGGATDGIMSHLFDSQFGDIGHTSLAAWPITLEEVYVIAVVASGSSSIVYMNGTPWCAGYREGDGVVGSTWDIGQNSGNAGPFFSSSDWTISNFAQWSSALAYADIISITETMLDAAAMAAAEVFT